MRVVNVRNVSEAWARLPGVLTDAEEQESRVGPVLVCPEPVSTVYQCPTERVLLDKRRDANPFFHLVEALWMLAGRDDAATLDHYVRDFGSRFGEGPEEARYIHGAYGHRWRHLHASVDQLDCIVEKLRNNPLDRQAVLQMWDMTNNCDLDGEWKDRPCNTHAYLRVRDSRSLLQGETYGPVLDLTVCCRSNDMVFGGYGANVVHFSVLQEYLAARIGVGVGTYTQISNNFHVYRDVWERVRPLAHTGPEAWTFLPCEPMFDQPERIDEDLGAFFHWHDQIVRGDVALAAPYHNQWFAATAVPVVSAYAHHRRGHADAAGRVALAIYCPAWRVACLQWLQRRSAK